MKAVFKYPFVVQDEFTLDVPLGKSMQVLKVEMQGQFPCIWALVVSDARDEAVRFRVVGTGHRHPDSWWVGWKHVGTFQQGQFVWHVFMEQA